MAQLISVRLTRPDNCPLGFRLQGGKDFGTPLVIQKVNGGSPAERAGLIAGDSVIKVNTTDVYALRHKEAQDVIVRAGQNFDITVQRGGSTWKPLVTPTGMMPSPSKSMNSISPVTQTSLKHNHQAAQHIGSGYNSAAKPFNYMNGNGDSVKSIVNKQYNTPVGIYSEQTIAETLSAQAEVLAGGVLGVNFKKNEKTYDSEKSEVFKMLQEADNDPEPEISSFSPAPPPPAVSGLRHVTAPITRPDAPMNNTGGLPPGQNICEECERLIIGVFVRIKDKNLHVECFKCATCGSSLKNRGYYNLNGKLYCDIHAKMVARQNPPADNLEPVTIPMGSLPMSTISSALSSHTMPLPPLAPVLPTSNGSSKFMPAANYKSEDQIDNSLNLKQDKLDAFATALNNGEHESKNNNSAPSLPPNTSTNLSVTPTINNNTVENNPAGGVIKSVSNETNNLIAGSAPSAVSSNDSVSANRSNATDNGFFKKVLPPHMGGNYKPMSNISGPKPFGSSMSPMAPLSACSLSPRSVQSIPSAPISPASTLTRPLQQAPISQPLPDSSTNPPTLRKNLKAEDLLNEGVSKSSVIKQLSKFAFDGNYEIGIQRKIKPGNRIASAAGKIQDTVVLMHPLRKNGPPQSTVNVTAKTFKNHNEILPSQNGETENFKNAKNINYNSSDPRLKIILNGVSEKDGCVPPPPPPPEFKSASLSPIDLKSTVNEKRSPSWSQHSSPMTSGSVSPARAQLANGYNGLETPPRQLTTALLGKLALNNALSKEISNSSVDKMSTHSNDVRTTVSSESLDLKPIEKSLPVEKKAPINGPNGNDTERNSHSFSVKLREKKRISPDDADSGKRDSHIVSRPLSTVASMDLVDGVYPICNQCNKEIKRGPFISALGRIWCPEHFVCVNNTCRRHLQDIGFVEENGQLYCEYCFEQFIAPACNKCHGKIKGDCLNAIGKHFHPECFNCAYCGKLFGNNPFFLEEGLPYCEADWNELFTTKCFACGFPVEAGDRWVEALNNNYHSQCFNCTMCKKNLEGQSFYAKGGRPFCKTHAR